MKTVFLIVMISYLYVLSFSNATKGMHGRKVLTAPNQTRFKRDAVYKFEDFLHDNNISVPENHETLYGDLKDTLHRVANEKSGSDGGRVDSTYGYNDYNHTTDLENFLKPYEGISHQELNLAVKDNKTTVEFLNIYDIEDELILSEMSTFDRETKDLLSRTVYIENYLKAGPQFLIGKK